MVLNFNFIMYLDMRYVPMTIRRQKMEIAKPTNVIICTPSPIAPSDLVFGETSWKKKKMQRDHVNTKDAHAHRRTNKIAKLVK